MLVQFQEVINKITIMQKLKIAIKYLFLKLVRTADTAITYIQIFRPSTHFASLRVLKEKEGAIAPGENICIFIIYENGSIPSYTIETLQDIKSLGIKLFLVINSNLYSDDQIKIENLADFYQYRNNIGKDIGGYKDAFIRLLKDGHLKNINKLIFANDSVVYPKKNRVLIFEDLIKYNGDLVGYSAVKEIHYHIQSFLFSCSTKLINNKKFISFWKNYLPVGRRRYMIGKGEVGITKAAIKSGLSIQVINNLDGLISHNLDYHKIQKIIYSLPYHVNSKIESYNNFHSLVNETTELIPRLLKDIKISIHDDILSSINNDTVLYKEILRKKFILELIEDLSQKNPGSYFPFLFEEIGMRSVIKRDVFYRGNFDENYFLHNLNQYFHEEAESIFKMLKKPSSNHLKGMKKFLFNNGML